MSYLVAIGRALMTRPTLVLLDEPSMDLAPIIDPEIVEIVAQLNRAEQVSFLIAEQNINVDSTTHRRLTSSIPAESLLARGDLPGFYSGKH